eukprot:GHVS01078651.1.p2 GENE.GHVS01078651.1~~GHVS01078651.1.p2  ORF type:complete len:136 (+),score=2.34 GHVS01078651.1:634-1041(+)
MNNRACIHTNGRIWDIKIGETAVDMQGEKFTGLGYWVISDYKLTAVHHKRTEVTFVTKATDCMSYWALWNDGEKETPLYNGKMWPLSYYEFVLLNIVSISDGPPTVLEDSAMVTLEMFSAPFTVYIYDGKISLGE